MPRVKRGTLRRNKRRRLLARAKGFYQTKSKLYRAGEGSGGDRRSSTHSSGGGARSATSAASG